MPPDGDRGTGTGPTTAGQQATRTAERGLPPTETLYVFHVEITRKARGARKRARHVMCWEAIFGATYEEFAPVFDARWRAGELGRLDGPIADSATYFIYKLKKVDYHYYAFPNKLQPVEIRPDDPGALMIEDHLLSVSREYETFRSRTDAIRRALTDRWLRNLLAHLRRNSLRADPEMFEILVMSGEVLDKLAMLDEVALHDLMDHSESRDGGEPSPFSVRDALRRLRALDWQLDDALAATRRRETRAMDTGSSLMSAIADLAPLGPAYAVRNRMIQELLHPRGGPWPLSPHRKELEQALAASLARAGLVGPGAVAEFERRIDVFRIRLRNALHAQVMFYLRRLLTRVQFTINQSKDRRYLERLFLGLRTYEAAIDRGLDPDDIRKTPDFVALERAYPILQFEGFRDQVIKAYRKYGKYRRRPESVFANAFRSDLIRKWKTDIEETIDTLGNKNKVWKADTFRDSFLTDLGVSEGSFLRIIAAKEQARIEAEASLRETLLTLLSIALTFVPAAGFIALASRVVAVGIDVKLGLEDVNSVAEVNRFNQLGLTEDTASPWLALVSLAGAGLDLDDIADILRVGRTTDVLKLADDVAIDPAIVPSRREMYARYLALRREELTKNLRDWRANVLSRAYSVPGANLPDLYELASVALRLGFTRFEEYFNFLAVKLERADLPRAQAKADYDRAVADLGNQAATALDVERLQRAVHDLGPGNLRGQLAEVKGRELEKEAGALRRRIGAAQEALLHARRHKEALRRQEAQLSVAINEAVMPKGGGRVPKSQLARTLKAHNKTIREQIQAITYILRGQPLDLYLRARAHEFAVGAHLRGLGHEVGTQIKLTVILSDYRAVDVIADSVIRLPDGRFRLVDAKHSDGGWVGTGAGALRKSLTPNQRLAYLEIAAGRAREVRFADAVSARQFKLSSDVTLEVEARVDLYLNRLGGGLRRVPLPP